HRRARARSGTGRGGALGLRMEPPLAGVEVGFLRRGGRGLWPHLHRLRRGPQLVDLRRRDRRGSRSRGLGDLGGRGRFFNLSGVALLAPVASEGEQRGPTEERRQEGLWIDLSHRWILAFQVSDR